MRRVPALAFLFVVGLAVYSPNRITASPDSSLSPVAIGSIHTLPPAGPAVEAAGSPGRVDATALARAPVAPYDPDTIEDGIAFTSDVALGLVITISGAEVGDRWQWNYFEPSGALVSTACETRIVEPAGAGNPSPTDPALVSFCGSPQPLVYGVFVGGCPCSPGPNFGFGDFLQIAGTTWEDSTGTWTVVVDFHDAAGTLTSAVGYGQIELRRTPLIALIHGWNSSCGGVNTLKQNLADELMLPSDRLSCFGYDPDRGAKSAGCDFQRWLADFGGTDSEQPEVDIVAHSMGGLVARYYAQYCVKPGDPVLGSISMLGTPNEGVRGAEIERVICPKAARVIPFVDTICTVVNVLEFVTSPLLPDIHSQAIDDFKPSSKVLRDLNEDYVLPAGLPVYRAHAGRQDSRQGAVISGSSENDCLVSQDSVMGPSNVFDSVLDTFEYPGVSHSGGLWGCDGGNTLTNNLAVAHNISPDIKGLTAPEEFQTAVAPSTSSAFALLSSENGVAFSTTPATHILNIPPGLSGVSLQVLWLDDGTAPLLGVAWKRPGGATVLPTDPDIIETLDLSGEQAFYIQSRGFAIAGPAAGAWEVTVTGTSVPTEGQPYLVMATPDSQVALSLAVEQPDLAEGSSQVITASLFDGAIPIPASISGTAILLDASEQSMSFADDGVAPDAVAADHVYTASFVPPALCGGYRVKATGTASTTEGTVTREQVLTFDVHVPNDAVRDPCKADEDEDGLLDNAEIDVHGTNPIAPDTDDDGLTDGDEVNVTGTDPLGPDTDGDGPLDGADNCPLAANAGQENTDGAWSNGPSIPGDDLTVPFSDGRGDACDDDADNDGLADADELSATACPPFDLSTTAHLNPARGDITADDDGDANAAPALGSDAADNGAAWDTDNDGVLDGVECSLGTNPRQRTSRPSSVACGGVADADADGLGAGVERCKWGTSDASTDIDGDGKGDCREVVDIDGDGVITFPGDVQRLANAYFGAGADVALDIDGDGTLTFPGDVMFAADVFYGARICV
jgi:hypothetical protein